jgi:hypothetical protein
MFKKWLQDLFLRFIEWLYELYKKWFSDEPPVKKAWVITVVKEQAAVRKVPDIEAPIDWILNVNETAVVGINDDGSLQTVLQGDKWRFYFIAFDKKRGWVIWKEDRMRLEQVIVEK